MIPLPGNVQKEIGTRVRAWRLREGWTQSELARRAGIAPITVTRLEQTGAIAMPRLLRVAAVLGALETFSDVFKADSQIESLEELRKPRRKRGRRRKVE